MKEPNFVPFRDRVLVRLTSEEEGAIKVPDGSRPKPQQGVIVAIGSGPITPDGQSIGPSFREGNAIYFGKYAGADIELDGQSFLIMREEEILGHVPPVPVLFKPGQKVLWFEHGRAFGVSRPATVVRHHVPGLGAVVELSFNNDSPTLYARSEDLDIFLDIVPE